MNFLLRANSNDENYNGDCDYFVVVIDKDIAGEILRRRKVFLASKKEDKALWESYYWGAHIECMSYSGIELDKGQQTLFDDNGFLDLPINFKVNDETGIRTECEQMCIREEGVSWTCYPKHSDGITITSAELPYALMEEML